MISILLQKINEMDKKVSDQQKQITDLRAKLVNSFISDEEIETGQATLRSTLFRLQGAMNKQINDMVGVKTQIKQQQMEMDALNNALVKPEEDPADRPLAESWKGSPGVPPQGQPGCGAEMRAPTERGAMGMIEPTIGVPMSCIQAQEKAPPRFKPTTLAMKRAAMTTTTLETPTEVKPAPCGTPFPRKNASHGETGGRLKDLEDKLKTKDNAIEDLLQKQETQSAKERTQAIKVDWYEHKLRLLKQDKRRRGETIGKLLRSIDQMKEAAKIQLSRDQEGSAILEAALQSQGLPTEQRIQAAINVTEAQRVPRHHEPLSLQDLIAATDQADVEDTEVLPGQQ